MKNLKLFPKTFLVSIGLFAALIVLVHALVYTLMPHFYLQQKEREAADNLTALVAELRGKSTEEMRRLSQEFAQVKNVNITLTIDGRDQYFQGFQSINIVTDSGKSVDTSVVKIADGQTVDPRSVILRQGSVTNNQGQTIAVKLLADVAPDAGRIILRPQASSPRGDDLALTDVDPVSWHSGLSWVPQSPTLIPGSILDNMAGLPLADLEEAARATGFDAVLATAPHGWESTIGSGGVGLSVGQRQRLALTRALAARSRVVILDEPTAHLDAVSEETVVRAITTMREEGRTVIVIAHRSAVIGVADTIIDVASAEEEALA